MRARGPAGAGEPGRGQRFRGLARRRRPHARTRRRHRDAGRARQCRAHPGARAGAGAMRTASFFAGAIILLLAGAPAAAQRDPAVPAWPVGDLIVSRPQPIAIVGEEVTVRPELVEIRYRFVNRSAAELEVPIVLPLPDIAPAIL